MRLLWLPDVLRRAGLVVHEYDGWRTRGLSTFGPVSGIVCHGTAGSLTSTDAGELRTIAITGSGTATAPIAQLYLSRSGAWWVVASGTCTGVLAGTAGPLKGLSDDAVLQIEAQHSTTEPWTEIQYRSYVRGVAALVAYREPGYDVTVDRVVGHSEHQPGQKTDPWLDMARFRRDVASVLSGGEVTMITVQIKGSATWWLTNGFTARPVPDWPTAQALQSAGVRHVVVADDAALWRLAGEADHEGPEPVTLLPEHLAVLEAAAERGAEAGVVKGADELAAALAPLLDVDVDELKAAMREVLGSAHIVVPAE